MSEVIETRECMYCSRLCSGNPESFNKWISYTEKQHQNSSEYKTYYACPTCQGIHTGMHKKDI
jgi:hypothetical protein